MAFPRAAKKHVVFLYNRISTSRQSSHGYTTWACRVPRVSDFREVSASFDSSNGCLPFSRGRQMFLRSFSAEVSSSEQLNLIKLLRESTSAPLNDVKSALVGRNWDIESAQQELREKGVVLASKNSSRNATGLLAVVQKDNKAAVIELNCETDVAAKNDIFQFLALSLANITLSVESPVKQVPTAFSVGPEYLEGIKVDLDQKKIGGETTVQGVITDVAKMLGENVKLQRAYTISKSSNGVISSYLHTSPQPGLGRIAGIVTLEVEDKNAPLEALERVGSELAMHIVAAQPLFLSKELVTSEALENELNILKYQAQAIGKSEMAIEKMVEDRMQKYMEEVVLMEQKFIVNDAINIKTLINDLSEEVGSPVKVGIFFRMEVGEGILRVDTSSSADVVAEAT